MAIWKSRGLRGSSLEELINIANDVYRKKELALVQKVPTPITPVEIDTGTRIIKKAYFNMKSTVDYIGVVQGVAICFDAKETRSLSYPLSNIHRHQYDFMCEFEKQGGIAFIIINFSKKNENFYLPFSKIKEFFDRMDAGGKKSFTYEELDRNFLIEPKKEVFLHYLEKLSEDIYCR